MFNKKYNSGFTLVEMIIYVFILTIISAVIINMLLSFTSTYRTVVALRIAENSGIDSMERITRDIRAASSVDLSNSILSASPGRLALTTTSGGVSTTTRFYLNEGILKVDVNGVFVGPLTVSKAQVTSLVFRLLDSGVSQAVRVDMTVQATVGSTVKTKTYHATVILKGS